MLVKTEMSYQPAYQLEFIVFFSHNKTASAGLSAGFNTSRTGCVLKKFLVFILQSPVTTLFPPFAKIRLRVSKVGINTR